MGNANVSNAFRWRTDDQYEFQKPVDADATSQMAVMAEGVG